MKPFQFSTRLYFEIAVYALLIFIIIALEDILAMLARGQTIYVVIPGKPEIDSEREHTIIEGTATVVEAKEEAPVTQRRTRNKPKGGDPDMK